MFRKKTIWKVALLVTALGISVASLLYTNNLADRLMKAEKKKVRLWAEAQKRLGKTDNPGFLLRVVQENETVPVILVGEDGKIQSSKNMRETGETYLREELKEMKRANDPIVIEDKFGNKSYVYYKESVLVTQLRYFPYVQLLIIALFFGVAYFAFSASRKYEQNKVWVGLAKETAHQLGTPLSSLMGWISYLKTTNSVKDTTIQELEKDVERLQVITDRFSKIGSSTHLLRENVYQRVQETVNYCRSRFTDKVTITIDEESNRYLKAKLNPSLFDWVIENLVKNAIDAIHKTGNIHFYIHEQSTYAVIDIADTGKGLSRSDFNNIFEPGYSTRKRGWGLGLSLSKRIIEQYHKGQIFVKSSEFNKGTTFRIKLMK